MEAELLIQRSVGYNNFYFYFYRPYDVALLDTFATASLNELDYIKEASNQERYVQFCLLCLLQNRILPAHFYSFYLL